MKTLAPFILMMFLSFFSSAQTDGISYQAVIIDNNPQEIPGVDVPSNNLPNTPIEVRFSIIDFNNQVEYQEIQQTETDAFGMINLTIGQGQITTETLMTFDQIYWDNEKFLRVEIDLIDGNGFVEFSYQSLTYIPYVRHREIIATSTLDVDGVTNLNNDFNVNNASSTSLSGSLTANGNTSLNANLTVNNQSPTYLTGDLTVDGLVSFDGELAVGGDTNLYSDLTVAGNTLLEGDLNVLGTSNFSDGIFENITVNQNSSLNTLSTSGATTLGSTLNVSGSTQINNNLTVTQQSALNTLTVNSTDADTNLNTMIVYGRSLLSGRVIINPALNNSSQTNVNSYPLEIRGRHGIWIGADTTVPSSNNNFLTFSNSSNTAVGAIEGQTLAELNNSFRFIWDATSALLEEAFIVAEGVACGTQLDLPEAGVMAVQGAAAYAHLLELTISATNNVGVSFKTGGADYAEFLEKQDVQMHFEPGEIVGVYGGKISKQTKDAQHIMVISTNPIVLGNMPEHNKNDSYEKVAFLGQVPVRVIGKVMIGDYILPSGNNDGLAMAKNPKDMNAEDYMKIVGVAWQESLNHTFGYVNVAIGLNTNDVAYQLKQQKEAIASISNELKSIKVALNLENDDDSAFNSKTEETTANDNTSKHAFNDYKNELQLSDQQFESWLNTYGYIFENRMTLLGNFLKDKNVEITKYPEIENLILNTRQALRDMNSGVYMKSLWASFQKRYPKAFVTD